MSVIILAALLGGFGAVCRFLVDNAVTRRTKGIAAIPLGTIVVNVTACLLMGLLTGWALAHVGESLTPQMRTLLGSGFLGGYSTFSTASVEGARLLRAGRPWHALVHTAGMLALSMTATSIGLDLML